MLKENHEYKTPDGLNSTKPGTRFIFVKYGHSVSWNNNASGVAISLSNESHTHSTKVLQIKFERKRNYDFGLNLKTWWQRIEELVRRVLVNMTENKSCYLQFTALAHVVWAYKHGLNASFPWSTNFNLKILFFSSRSLSHLCPFLSLFFGKVKLWFTGIPLTFYLFICYVDLIPKQVHHSVRL